VVEEIPARTGKMGHFYLGFQTFAFVEMKKQNVSGAKDLTFRFHEILRLRSE